MISGVTERLQAAGCPVTTGHWRPLALDRNGRNAGASANAPHGQEPRDVLTSILKLGWLWLNWWIAWWRFLRRASKNGVVLFDRFHADLLVDPLRYRYGGPIWLARLASQMMPQPDYIVFLDADPDLLLARKQEVSRDALMRSRSLYLGLSSSHPQLVVVDASQRLPEVIRDVIELLDMPDLSVN